MKRPIAYIITAWYGGDSTNAEQVARYCRAVYEAGFAPICPALFLPLFLNDAVPEEHKSSIDIGRDLLQRSRILVVCDHTVTKSMKNDIAVAQRLGITVTTLEGILTITGQVVCFYGLPHFCFAMLSTTYPLLWDTLSQSAGVGEAPQQTFLRQFQAPHETETYSLPFPASTLIGIVCGLYALRLLHLHWVSLHKSEGRGKICNVSKKSVLLHLNSTILCYTEQRR